MSYKNVLALGAISLIFLAVPDAGIAKSGKDGGGAKASVSVPKIGGGGGSGKSIGGGGGKTSGGSIGAGRLRDLGGRGDDDDRRRGERSGNGKVGGRGFLGGHNWGDSPIGGEFFGGRSFDGGIGGRLFDDGNPRGVGQSPSAGGGGSSSSAGTSSTSGSPGSGGSAGSGGASVSFGGPSWPGSGAQATAAALASGRGQSAGTRAVILTAVAGSAAEASAAAAKAADDISGWPWANAEVAQPTLGAANAALAAGKSAQGALLAEDSKSAKLLLDTARKHAQDSRAQAQAAVQAWQKSPGFGGRSRAAAEAAVRAAEAAGVEIQVAARALSIAENRAVAQRGIDSTSAQTVAAAPAPTRKPAPSKPGVQLAALTDPGKISTPAPSVSNYTQVMERAETAAVRAAKANADAQIAAIGASATLSPSEARRHSETARQAADDAKSAAEAAAQALTEARALAQKNIDSVAAQAQAEVAGRAAEKARMHAQAAAAAAERAGAFGVAGDQGDAARVTPIRAGGGVR